MSEFPSLSEVLAKHEAMRDPFRQCQVCICDEWADTDHGDNGHHTHVDHQGAAWRESCTIRTFEELDALPALAVISSDPEVTGDGNRWTWERFDEGWFTTAFGPAGYPDLPALLIWHPSWARS